MNLEKQIELVEQQRQIAVNLLNEVTEENESLKKQLEENQKELADTEINLSTVEAINKQFLEAMEGIIRIKNLLGADDEYYNMPEHQGEGEAVYKAFQKIESVITSANSKL